MILVAFVLGAAVALPVPGYWLPWVLLCYLIYNYRIPLVIMLFVGGMLVTYVHLVMVRPGNLPDKRVIHQALIEGEISQLPKLKQGKTTIILMVSQFNDQRLNARFRLTCYRQCPPLRLGDKVRMRATIKKPHDLQNPGTFAFSRYLWANHIDRIGTIYAKTIVILGHNQGYWLDAVRHNLAEMIDIQRLNADAKSLLAALTLGVTDNFRSELWQQFQQTGTAHLMVISGAHIGLLAGFSFFLFNGLWKRIPRVCLFVPSQRFAAFGAMLITLAYALISGFAVPAQRAVIMTFALLSRYLGSIYLSSWQAWNLALVICVAMEPHSLVMPGFYLSFIAVAVILFISPRLPSNRIGQLVGLQACVMLGLMPLSLFIFHYQAFNGLLANLILIPYVSLILLPVALIKLLLIMVGLSGFGNGIFQWLVDGLLSILLFCQHFTFLNWHFTLQALWQVLAMYLALMLVLLIANRYTCQLAALIWMTALLPKTIMPAKGHAQIDILDVGQGLAILISTNQHRLLYDTGLRFYGGSGDMGERVILPFLQYYAINRLDSIVISHPDLDHRGGLLSLLHVFPDVNLITDDPKFYQRGTNCHQTAAWVWDGIRFEFLPLTPFAGQKNNHSCVLKVSSATRSVLLTGDIEHEAESYLLQHYSSKLPSHYLIIPHHGSKTSTSSAFLRKVHPEQAVISSGLDNRYHFPHKIVMDRLQNQAISVQNTAFSGRIILTL